MSLGQDFSTFFLAKALFPRSLEYFEAERKRERERKRESKVGRGDKSKIFWPAGECVARPVACRPHCRRRGRLNPFKGVVMVKASEGWKEEDPRRGGTDFYDSIERGE